MQWQYRARQFLMRLSAHSEAIDKALVWQVLGPRAYWLFARMSLGDQLHAVHVLHDLRSLGPISLELEQAALLHDVGKSEGPVTLLYRVAIVLLRKLSPGLLRRLAVSDSRSWRYPLLVCLEHAERGARLCEAAGCSPIVVALVRYHDPSAPAGAAPEPALAEAVGLLRLADDRA